MSDLGVEQIVKVTAPKISLLYKAAMIIACLLSAITIPQVGVYGMFLLIMFIVCTVLLFEYYNAEYEYSLMSEVLTIDRIMSKNSRRRGGVFDISRTSLIANIKSQDALRMEHMDLRTYDFTSGVGTDDSIIVVYTYDNEVNEKIRLLIEPNDEMLQAISEIVGKTVYKVEKSI